MRPTSINAPYFDPPLWMQRRSKVLQILRTASSSTSIQSILDLGCGEGSLLQILANDNEFSYLAGIDFDQDEVQAAIVNCSPLEMDFRYLRERPMVVDLYKGDIREIDDNIRDFGFDAIACVEKKSQTTIQLKLRFAAQKTSQNSIEHMYLEDVPSLSKNALGIHRPKIVIVTTPNAEFNINFEGLHYGTPESKFRHDDHKFEWTRAEFQSWAEEAAKEHGYQVHFDGVGYAKGGENKEGPCTQFAIFQRNDINFTTAISSLQQSTVNSSAIVPQNPTTKTYTHIHRITFPHFTEEFTNLQILEELKNQHVQDIVYYDVLGVVQGSDEYQDDGCRLDELMEKYWPKSCGGVEIMMKRFWEILRVRQICKTRARLREVFKSDEAKQLFTFLEPLDAAQVLFPVSMPVSRISEPEAPSSDEDEYSDDDQGGWGDS
ncbi:Small RNA 2'-O-methyltransferase [Blyttiomyces sp. JEL0837]|nr:Small RNA 2'-O-methyltransferase [Blyttiomyces sp. JEL0837]